MGRLHVRHLGGKHLYSCTSCDTFLTNKSELISMRFTGATGQAFLFNRVVNLKFSGIQDRIMMTGRHLVRDVFCKSCDTKLGWFYEFAAERTQIYKEGKVILEKALVTETSSNGRTCNNSRFDQIKCCNLAAFKCASAFDLNFKNAFATLAFIVSAHNHHHYHHHLT